MKGFGIYVKNDLLELKHIENMGVAVWLYMWCLDKMTSINEQGVGKILGGKPIKYEEVARELGISLRTYRRWISLLSNSGYINIKRTPYGMIISVNKAVKKFGRKLDGSENSVDFLKIQSQKMSDDRRGPKHYNWKGGITPENHSIRMSKEMREWRQEVFERDLYTCKNCGKRGGKLEADHIKPFSTHPELRFELANGQTLCEECHEQKTTKDLQNMRSAKNSPQIGHNRHFSGQKVAHVNKTVQYDNTKTSQGFAPQGARGTRVNTQGMVSLQDLIKKRI